MNKYVIDHIKDDGRYMIFLNEIQHVRSFEKVLSSLRATVNCWFREHYEKTDEICEDGYGVVKVRTSHDMIVHWAMQYGTRVEIMDEDIREKIREEIEKLKEKYE